MLEKVCYLKVDYGKLNVHTINPKGATKIKRGITKKPTKNITIYFKNTQSKRRQKEEKEERRQKECELRSNTFNKTKK